MSEELTVDQKLNALRNVIMVMEGAITAVATLELERAGRLKLTDRARDSALDFLHQYCAAVVAADEAAHVPSFN